MSKAVTPAQRELPEWPSKPTDTSIDPFRRWDSAASFLMAKSAFWESRCREAVEALKEYQYMGIGPWEHNQRFVAKEALSRIGPLPPEETSRE